MENSNLGTCRPEISDAKLVSSLKGVCGLKDKMTLKRLYGPFTNFRLQQDMEYAPKFRVHLVLHGSHALE